MDGAEVRRKSRAKERRYSEGTLLARHDAVAQTEQERYNQPKQWHDRRSDALRAWHAEIRRNYARSLDVHALVWSAATRQSRVRSCFAVRHGGRPLACLGRTRLFDTFLGHPPQIQDVQDSETIGGIGESRTQLTGRAPDECARTDRRCPNTSTPASAHEVRTHRSKVPQYIRVTRSSP